MFSLTRCILNPKSHRTIVEERFHSLQSLRYLDPHQEIDRLKKIGGVRERLLSAEIVQASTTHQIALGRAFEIFKSVNKTHFVFFHGEPHGHFLVLRTLYKILHFWDKHASPLEHETLWGYPSAVCCLSSEPKKSMSLLTEEEKKRQLASHKLLLVTANPSLQHQNAPLYSFLQDTLSIQEDLFQREALQKLLENIVQDSKMRLNTLEELKTLDISTRVRSKGTLNVVVIPKKRFSEFGILSDLPRNLLTNFQEREIIIENMQEDTTGKLNFSNIILFTERLDSNVVKSFSFSTLEDTRLNRLEDAVKKILHKAGIGSPYLQ